MPTAWDLIENEISVNKEELFSLPQSFSDNPQQRVFGLCDDFTKRVTECTIGKGHSDNIIDSYLCDKYKELRDRILATCPQFEVPESRRTQSPLLTPSSSTPTTLSLDESKSDTADTLEHPPGQEGNTLNDILIEISHSSSKGQGSYKSEFEETIAGRDRHNGSGSRIHHPTCVHMAKALPRNVSRCAP